MKHRKSLRPTHHRARTRRGAFTLIEVLVALGVLMLLMGIILVPINVGMDLFHIGKARSEVQQANQLVINQLVRELKKAVFVFPNEAMVGITDRPPYSNDPDIPEAPYYDPELDERVSNTARLDFLLPALDNTGAFLMPPVANNYIVTYYARRLKVEDEGVIVPYDEFSNPMVLWRAQHSYKTDSGALVVDASDISSKRYDDLNVPSSIWLTQTAGEPKHLEGQTTIPSSDVLSASHTQLTPRDMMMVVADEARANLVDTDPDHSLQTDSSFIADDTNLDGKIDRVTISLLLAKYDSIGAAGKKSQGIRSTQTVALPNIR